MINHDDDYNDNNHDQWPTTNDSRQPTMGDDAWHDDGRWSDIQTVDGQWQTHDDGQ